MYVSRTKSRKGHPLLFGITTGCVLVVLIIANFLYSQTFVVTFERYPRGTYVAGESQEQQRTTPDTSALEAKISSLQAQLKSQQHKTEVQEVQQNPKQHTTTRDGRQFVLPTEQEIQQWERIALNFSRAGHTAMIGNHPKPAYPINLYNKWIKEGGHTVCSDWKMFGDKRDGGWPVCMTDTIKSKKCVVYSFGVGADYSFEKAISPYCEVHSFDPTPHIVAMMKKIEHKINWKFHPWGLDSYPHNGTFQMYTTGDRPVSVRFESVPSLMTLFGHDKVDVVKIDVEGYEVFMWHEVFDIQMGVEQLLFELHPLTRDFVNEKEKLDHGVDKNVFFDWTDWLVMLTACFRNGFRPFWAKQGRYNHAGGLQEFAFMRQWKHPDGNA